MNAAAKLVDELLRLGFYQENVPYRNSVWPWNWTKADGNKREQWRLTPEGKLMYLRWLKSDAERFKALSKDEQRYTNFPVYRRRWDADQWQKAVKVIHGDS